MINETNEYLEIARLHADIYGYCPEKGVSHDSRPCCVCGKTIHNDQNIKGPKDFDHLRDK